MTGSIRNFEKLNFTPKSSVFCFSQGQTSKYDRLAHFRDLLRFIQENKKRVDQKDLNTLKNHENVLINCIHSGKGPNPSLIKKYHLVLEHLQKVSKKKDFSDYRNI